MAMERRGLARGLKIWLDVLFFAVLAVGVMLAVSLPISLLPGYDDGWDANVPVSVGEGTFFPQLHVQVESTEPDSLQNPRVTEALGKLRFLHHHLSWHLGNSAVYLLFMGLFLWGVTLLRRILVSTTRGQPFHPSNPRRLNLLGWIILSSAVLSSVLQYLASRWILSKVTVTTLPLSPPIQINEGWVLCGLLTLVLAGIWKEAVRMAEEQSLTV